ncbi:MAG: hypothetical protein NT124_00415 [Candidatus Dependentiae bacterium]|nr:hypothetical protein [Candidatus Dependentiae bacterium]
MQNVGSRVLLLRGGCISIEQLNQIVGGLVDEVNGVVLSHKLGDFFRDFLADFNSIKGQKTVGQLYGVGLKLIEINILQALYSQIIKGEENIFVFAGSSHITNIIPVLEKGLGCQKCPFEGSEKYDGLGKQVANFLMDTWESCKHLSQEEKMHFVDSYKRDIGGFFAQESAEMLGRSGQEVSVLV